jgi:hypothetical protein
MPSIQSGLKTERDAAHAQALRANAAAVRVIAQTHLCTVEHGAHPVLFRIARSLGDVGLVSEACTAFEELLADLLPVLGPDHPTL